MTETCEGCGKPRVLREHSINQWSKKRLCKKCIEDDHAKRSEAAAGKAGRPPKSDSQLEDALLKCALTRAEMRLLERWFVLHGYTGTNHQMLKQWAKAMVLEMETLLATKKR